MKLPQIRSLIRGASDVLLMLSASPDLRKALPEIFARLDIIVPVLLASKATPGALVSEVSEIVALTIKRPARTGDIALLMRLYSPAINALRGVR